MKKVKSTYSLTTLIKPILNTPRSIHSPILIQKPTLHQPPKIPIPTRLRSNTTLINSTPHIIPSVPTRVRRLIKRRIRSQHTKLVVLVLAFEGVLDGDGEGVAVGGYAEDDLVGGHSGGCPGFEGGDGTALLVGGRGAGVVEGGVGADAVGPGAPEVVLGAG